MTYIKRKSKKQEDRTAKDFGGRTTLASGALWTQKADVRTGSDRTSSFNEDDYLIENKFTDADKYKLDRTIWEKIAKEALRDNFRTPLMQIDIQDLQLVVMDTNTFRILFEGYDVKKYNGVTDKKTYVLEKTVMNDYIDRAKADNLIPIFHIVFSSTLRYALYSDLIVVTKDDFINR